MIHARMDWRRMELMMWGHAGYAQAGKDIVCAGASMLFDALVGTLRDAEERGRTTAAVRERGESTVIITADPSMNNVSEIKAYYRMAVKGLKMLGEQYPENVELKEVQ